MGVHPIILVLANELFLQTKSKLVRNSIYCNWLQIQIQIVLLGSGVLRLAQHKGKRRGGRGIPGGCARRRQRAGPPFAQSSPPGREGRSRAREDLLETRERFEKRSRGRR